KGKIVTINFMYATCQVSCPATTANLVKVQAMLAPRVGRDIFMYSVTLKPREDTPGVLREYARMHGVKPGWTFLTGRHDDVERLRRKLGFVDPDPKRDANVSNHIGLLLAGNESIDRWAACPALTDAAELAKFIGWMDGPRE